MQSPSFNKSYRPINLAYRPIQLHLDIIHTHSLFVSSQDEKVRITNNAATLYQLKGGAAVQSRDRYFVQRSVPIVIGAHTQTERVN